MPDPIDVEKDLFGHIAAAHLRTGNMLRMVHRSTPILLYAKVMENLKYGVYQEGRTDPEIVYDTARDAVQHFLDIHKRHRIPLGDVMFAAGNGSGVIAVTWRHLKVRLPTLKWVLKDDGTVIAGILEEAMES
jgi:hypothetical protein